MSLNALFTESSNGSKPGYNVFCQDLCVYGTAKFANPPVFASSTIDEGCSLNSSFSYPNTPVPASDVIVLSFNNPGLSNTSGLYNTGIFDDTTGDIIIATSGRYTISISCEIGNPITSGRFIQSYKLCIRKNGDLVHLILDDSFDSSGGRDIVVSSSCLATLNTGDVITVEFVNSSELTGSGASPSIFTRFGLQLITPI